MKLTQVSPRHSYLALLYLYRQTDRQTLAQNRRASSLSPNEISDTSHQEKLSRRDHFLSLPHKEIQTHTPRKREGEGPNGNLSCKEIDRTN